MIRSYEIVDKVQSYIPDADIGLIEQAYFFAANAHRDQYRKSGAPYFEHPLEVAWLLADMKMDVASVATGLLHDTVEDTVATLDDIKERFGAEVAFLVDGVTKLSSIKFTSQEQKMAENFRKMLMAMAKDLRVIIIKLADRLHNMRTLDHMSPDGQVRIARETREVYAPLAHRLGMHFIKGELEDLAFKYLEPAEYERTLALIAQTQEARDARVQDIQKDIEARLAGQGLVCEVKGRPKRLYSIYRKMGRNLVDFNQIHDLVAFRIIVEDLADCYTALGYCHTMGKPIPGRFKDYIAIPKVNGYQSVHTTIIGWGGTKVEIQIRTRAMDRIAEEGVAAHWNYKEGGKHSRDDERFAWLRRLLEVKDEGDPDAFLELVKLEVFADEVYLFSPKGDCVALPRGATPVDFAFAIHTEVGLHCQGAKIDGHMVPLSAKLHNGQVVEIITSKTQKPNPDWLSFVVTGRAASKIRAFINEEKREKSLEIGTDILDRVARKVDSSVKKLQKSGDLDKVAGKLKCKDGDEVIRGVAVGKFDPAQVMRLVLGEDEYAKHFGPAAAPADKAKGTVGRLLDKVTEKVARNRGAVVVEGLHDILVHRAKCCNPIHGDPIAGFITRGKGVTVHGRDCPHVLEMDPDRRVEVQWSGEAESADVAIRVVTDDRPGVLAIVSNAISKENCNITSAVCKSMSDERAVNTFHIGVKDVSQLRKVMRSIERLSGVVSVERMRSLH